MTLRLFTVLFIAITALPATAGTISVNNGQAQWTASSCQQPAAPQFRDGGGNAFNYNVRINQDYTNAVQNYLTCLANEANADQQARPGMAIDLASVNDAWISDLAQRQVEIDSKRAR